MKNKENIHNGSNGRYQRAGLGGERLGAELKTEELH